MNTRSYAPKIRRLYLSDIRLPLPSCERGVRAKLRASLPHSFRAQEKVNTVLNQIGIAVMLATLMLFAATIAGAENLADILAKRKPEATIDLATSAGTQLVKGQWRYSDTKIIEVDFKAAGADGHQLPRRRVAEVGEHAALARVDLSRAGHLGVGRVYVNGRRRVGADALDDPDVVGVRVGEDHGVDVGEARAARAQILDQLRMKAGQRRVDQRHAVAVLDQVAVDEGVAEAVDAGGDLCRSV